MPKAILGQLVCQARWPFRSLERPLRSRVARDFSTWIADRIDRYEFHENQEFLKVFPQTGEYYSKGGRPNVEYCLTVDMAKELAMIERTDAMEAFRQNARGNSEDE